MVFGSLFRGFVPAFDAGGLIVNPFVKATDPGPFTMGIQVPVNVTQTLTIPRGTQVGGDFYTNWDSNQGWLACWFTPAWNGNDANTHYILQWSANGYLRKNASNQLELSVASGVTVVVDVSAWTAGSTYRVEARWDADNAIDGSSNHLCISINDSDTVGRNSDYTPETPAASIYVGTDSAGANGAAGIIGGLTVYRRVGYDGTNGINVGWGDETALTTDKVYTTGSWDLLWCLATNATAGALSLAQECWSHPHGSNQITPADGFMLGTAWANWSDEGSPINKAVLAAVEKIYPGGYKYESDAANEGCYIDVPVSGGGSLVVRAVGHSDGTSVPSVVLYDVTNGAVISQLSGSTAATRTAPSVLVFTGQPVNHEKAHGRLQWVSNPADGDAVTIGTYIYRFKTDITGPPAGEVYVKRGANSDLTGFNLGYAVHNIGAGAFFNYGAGTGAHPTVSIWPGVGDYARGVWAKTAGAAGNAIVLTSATAAIVVDAVGHLQGGSDNADCTTVRVKLINTAASGVTYWHQVEVLVNKVPYTTMNNGDGDPWTPWKTYNSSATVGVQQQDATTGVSDSTSYKCVNHVDHCQFHWAAGANVWIGGGAWMKVDPGGASEALWQGSAGAYCSQNDGTVGQAWCGRSNAAVWTHKCGVFRTVSASFEGAVCSSAGVGYTSWHDDVYLIQLVPLTLVVV